MKLTTHLFAAAVAAAIIPGAHAAYDVAAPDHVIESSAATPARRFIPFGVGEKIDYEVKYTAARVGQAAMEVVKVENVRGKPAYNVQLRLNGSAMFGLMKVNTVLTSWMDTTTLNSLQFFSDQEQNGKDRERFYDIYPDREMFRLRWKPDTLPEEASVGSPLDDASFLYFIRTAPLEVGKTYEYDRYFKPDRNPVVVRVLRKETVKVPAGEFPAILVQPVIKTSGLFSEGGEAKVWLSDDLARIILKIETKTPVIGALHLNMTGYTPPAR